MRRLILLLIALLALSASLPAMAQDKPPDIATLQAQLEESQLLLAQRRAQAIAMGQALDQSDAKLKWVLDTWVPKNRVTGDITASPVPKK